VGLVRVFMVSCAVIAKSSTGLLMFMYVSYSKKINFCMVWDSLFIGLRCRLGGGWEEIEKQYI